MTPAIHHWFGAADSIKLKRLLRCQHATVKAYTHILPDVLAIADEIPSRGSHAPRLATAAESHEHLPTQVNSFKCTL